MNFFTKVRVICHRQEYAADFQLGIDLALDALYRADQLRHILGGEIVYLNRNKNVIRSRQGVDDQRTERGAAVQQHIIIVVLHGSYIGAQDGFTADFIYQPHLNSGQSSVRRDKIKAFVMLHDLWVLIQRDRTDHGVHNCAERVSQLDWFALAQHLCEITLGVYIYRQNLFAVHGQSCGDVVDAGAFSNATFLIGYGDHFALRHLWLLLSVEMIIAALGCPRTAM